MHDVGTRWTPLLGAHSRLGWNHPGPLLFWLGAPGQRAFGPSGVLATVALLHLLSVAASLGAARRLGAVTLLAIIGATAAVLIHSIGAVRLVDPWNPHLTYLPLLAFFVCAAASAERGPSWTLPAAVISGSLAAQSHLGALPVVLAGVLGAVLWRLTIRRHEHAAGEATIPLEPTDGHRRKIWVGSVTLGIGLWSGPLLQQLTEQPGNGGLLLQYILHRPGEQAGLADSLGAAARQLGFPPAWTFGREFGFLQVVRPAGIWTLGLSAAILATAWASARRAGAGTAARLVSYAAWLGLVAVAAVTRTTDGLLAYVLRWTWPVGAFGAAAATNGYLRSRPARASRVIRSTALAIAVGITAVASLATVIEISTTDLVPIQHNSIIVEELAREVRATVPPDQYRLETRGEELFAGNGESLGVDLYLHGYGIVFPASSASSVRDDRTRTEANLPVLLVVGGGVRAPTGLPTGSKRVASYWEGTPQQDGLRRNITARIVDGSASADDFRKLAQLPDRRHSYEVWLIPPAPQN